ncbi:hypothetical protein D3C71_2080860 [compost metagenome]
MGAFFWAEHLGDQLAGAVGDEVLLGEVFRAVDQAHQLDDALDAVEVSAHGRLQGAHQVNGN